MEVKCIRVYPGGFVRVELRRPGIHTANWIEYNTKNRFKCTLFVNNYCVRIGCLTEREARKILENPNRMGD